MLAILNDSSHRKEARKPVILIAMIILFAGGLFPGTLCMAKSEMYALIGRSFLFVAGAPICYGGLTFQLTCK